MLKMPLVGLSYMLFEPAIFCFFFFWYHKPLLLQYFVEAVVSDKFTSLTYSF